MPNRKIIDWVLCNGIDLLYENDSYLLWGNVHERTIAAQFACYLRRLLPGFDVDAEYNRELVAEKENKKNANQKKIKESLVIPDIIIHKRGENERNCMVLEIKVGNSTKPDKKDEQKLRAIKEKFNYRYAVFLRLSNTGVICKEWY